MDGLSHARIESGLCSRFKELGVPEEGQLLGSFQLQSLSLFVVITVTLVSAVQLTKAGGKDVSWEGRKEYLERGSWHRSPGSKATTLELGSFEITSLSPCCSSINIFRTL
ncbi:hypothetical protein VNO77_41807 [Canavalia gladiata]|uniref:Uncharacterized protein n=1 Tax=Canavalia gladiata TaxID=3824 RepID=A0AAN9PSA9_CANGL